MSDWSDVLIQRLRVLWDEGLSTAEIGRRLGVTKCAVVGKAHRLDLPARPSPIRRGQPIAPRKPRRVRSAVTLPALTSVQATAPIAPGPLPATRYTISGRETAFRVSDHKRDSVRGPTLATTADAYDRARRHRELFVPSNMASKQFPPERKCLWPHGEPGTRQYRVCEARVVTPGPYCDDCRKRAYARTQQEADAA